MGVRYDFWRARVPKQNNIFSEGGWKLVVHITVLKGGDIRAYAGYRGIGKVIKELDNKERIVIKE
jgi:hypothetical protein